MYWDSNDKIHFQSGGKIYGKDENAFNKQLILSDNVFQKASFSGFLKVQINCKSQKKISPYFF